ncbi:MAG: LacI family DNA-binding transcriptional regulator [Rhodobacteraceae bacterium]|nr:LacI family DNA-binding transcriptional regulator [Paracoccaceae bacterium]
MQNKKITLDDLSEHLQLSKFSVSRALRGKKGVSSETRELVLKAARDLGYKHSSLETEAAARSIRLVIPRDDARDNPAWFDVIEGAEEEARKMGYSLVTTLAEEDGDLSNGGTASGILLAGRRSRGVLESYLALPIPVVLIGYPKPGEAIDTVHISDWEGGDLIGSHLKALNHRHVAFVTDAPDDAGRQERLRGLRGGLAPDGQVSCLHYDPENETDPSALLRRIEALPDRPTVLVCASDAVCLSTILALQQSGAQIPDDFSIVGGNRQWSVAMTGVDVTSLSAPMHELGRQGLLLLHERIGSPTGTPYRRVALAPTLRIREASLRDLS